MKSPFNLAFAVLTFASLLSTYDSDAQAVVNIEQKRIVTDTIGWAGSANISFQFNKDVQEQFALSNRAHVQYKTEKSLYLLLANLALLEAGDNDFINSGFVHFRYNRKVGEILRWEVFTQLQYNKLLEVNQRVLIGTGPRLKIFSDDKLSLYQATLYMFEYEEIIAPREFHNDHRISTYVSASWNPTDNTSLSSTIYFQPLIEDFSDHRLSNQTRLSFGITKKIKFTTTFTYLRDSNPPLDVPSEAYSMRNGLEFKF
jgi:hypothetical protein